MPTTELPHALATRFVALDVHHQYLVVGAVDSQQQVVLTPRRFGFAAFAEWAPVHLTHADAVVFEATSNAWQLYDQLQPLVYCFPTLATAEVRDIVESKKPREKLNEQTSFRS